MYQLRQETGATKSSNTTRTREVKHTHYGTQTIRTATIKLTTTMIRASGRRKQQTGDSRSSKTRRSNQHALGTVVSQVAGAVQRHIC